MACKLARELNGLKYIYSDYLDCAFSKLFGPEDIKGVNVSLVKKKACESIGLIVTLQRQNKAS